MTPEDERIKDLYNWFDDKDLFGMGSICWVLIKIAEILTDILKEMRIKEMRRKAK